jgi:hypothetical protein
LTVEVFDLKLPLFAEQEVAKIHAEMSPEKVSIGTLLAQQAEYNKKAVLVEGTVLSVVSVDKLDEETVGTWFMNLPTTVRSMSSATYFYLESDSGQKILVKYTCDLDVSAQDKVAVAGIFYAYGVQIQTKGLLRTKQEEALNPLGEPVVVAITVENQTKQKLEYIRKKGQ